MLAPGSDRLPVELFQILKDDAVESAALNMQYALNTQYAGSWQTLLRIIVFLICLFKTLSWIFGNRFCCVNLNDDNSLNICLC